MLKLPSNEFLGHIMCAGHSIQKMRKKVLTCLLEPPFFFTNAFFANFHTIYSYNTNTVGIVFLLRPCPVSLSIALAFFCYTVRDENKNRRKQLLSKNVRGHAIRVKTNVLGGQGKIILILCWN